MSVEETTAAWKRFIAETIKTRGIFQYYVFSHLNFYSVKFYTFLNILQFYFKYFIFVRRVYTEGMLSIQ